MRCEAGRCKTSTLQGIFIVTLLLEGWPTKPKQAPSPHKVRLVRRDTNPVFQSLDNIDSVLTFLHDMYNDGCLYSGLYAAQSALASVVTIKGFVKFSDHPLLVRYPKRIFNRHHRCLVTCIYRTSI